MTHRRCRPNGYHRQGQGQGQDKHDDPLRTRSAAPGQPTQVSPATLA